MPPALSPHHLSDADLSALAVGEFTILSIRKLAAAESSKHALLLEALRRASDDPDEAECAAEVADAISVLSEVQARAPGVVTDILTLPHFGFWAAGCITRLRVGLPGPSAAQPSWSADLAHLAGFAAVAALRVGHPCELRLPVRDGMVFLPTLGVARLAAAQHGADRLSDAGEPGWARLTVDSRGAKVALGLRSVDVPMGAGYRRAKPSRHWSPVRRLRVRARGLTLEVILEDADPFLTRLGSAAADRVGHEHRAWLRQLRGAWRILTRHHRATALGLAAGLTTLVPLRPPERGRPLSATSGLAWGAIAVSLPQDALSLAEALLHEFQHLVLSAIDDVTPLFSDDGGQLRYAPWRDDPRPLDGLIQGTYAYLGLARFWRQQRRLGRRGLRLRGETEFARQRHAALEAARGLAGSAALTTTGRSFTAAMVACLTAWQAEAVPPHAEAMACEAAAEHWLRWRLTHLCPDGRAIELLARAWAAGQPPAVSPQDLPVTLVPWARSWPDGRSHLLTLRYRDPRSLDRELRDRAVSAPDVALLRGKPESARDGYLRAIESGASPGAWVGLILARRRLAGRASDWAVAERPEVIAAVYDRVGELTGAFPEADALVAWLAVSP